jgi:hypothetical protein
MAFLKETVGSLRAYFVLVAVLGAVVNVVNLFSGASWLVAAIAVVGFGFCVAYFYLGVRLKHLLATAPGQITGVLIAGAVFLVLVFVIDAASAGLGATEVRPIGGLLITWYLLRNVRRLAAEAYPKPPM